MNKNIKQIGDFEKMISGKLYNPTSKDVNKEHMKGLLRCDKYNRLPLWRLISKKRVLEKLIPSSKNKNLGIFAPFYCEFGTNIKVGKDVFVNYNCTFLDVCPIELDDGVWIGANVTLATPMHPFVAEERLPAEYPDGFHDLEYALPIKINKGCWVCSGATVCGGVTIGENSIVAAGAVVTKDVPPNTIVAGVPAKVMREIDENDRIDVWNTYLNNQDPISKRKQGNKSK